MAKFKFEKISKFWTSVHVRRPDGEMQEFEAQFVYLPDKEWAAKNGSTNADFLREHWTGWRGIVVDVDDGQGGKKEQELPFSAEQRELFFGDAFVLIPVMTAYIDGRQGLRAKN